MLCTEISRDIKSKTSGFLGVFSGPGSGAKDVIWRAEIAGRRLARGVSLEVSLRSNVTGNEPRDPGPSPGPTHLSKEYTGTVS